MSGHNGFVCEINSDKMKVYMRALQLVEFTIDPEKPVVLGDWILLVNDEEYQMFKFHDLPHFKVWPEDGNILVQLLVTGPNGFALSDDLAEKYHKKVWSPYLNLLDDTNSVYSKNFTGGEVGEVIARFKENGDTFFEVLRPVPWDKKPEEINYSHYKMTPWFLQEMASQFAPIHEQYPMDLVTTNRMKVIGPDFSTIGLCIHHNYQNPCYQMGNAGSQNICALLWSPILGLTRWLFNPKGIEPQLFMLGEWYKYHINDVAIKNKGREQNKLTFYRSSASGVRRVHKIKPTKRVKEVFVIDGNEVEEDNIEIECSFPFKHDDLEKKSFQKRNESWKERKSNLRSDASFTDLELGKVEIYPSKAQFLIQKVEAFQKEMKEKNFDEFKRLETEPIFVHGVVSLLRSFFNNFTNYPKNGLFFLKKTTTISYMSGPLIWELEEE